MSYNTETTLETMYKVLIWKSYEVPQVSLQCYWSNPHAHKLSQGNDDVTACL